MLMQLDLFQLVGMLLSEKRKKRPEFHPAKVTEFLLAHAISTVFQFYQKSSKRKKIACKAYSTI